MGRRGFGKMPEIRLHKRSGNGRVFIHGREYWLGPYGSPEARQRYEELIAAYVISKGRSVEAAAPPPCPVPTLTVDLTVGELAVKWLRDIKASRPDYRRTSLWHGALSASRAVRPFATMPVGNFGSRALIEVQRLLIETPVPARQRTRKPSPPRPDAATGQPPATPDRKAATTTRRRKPATPVYRSRRYINDIVGRVRQMFHWGVLRELVPDDRVKALEIVPALAMGATKARESKRRRAVRVSVVKATLPFLTAEVRDLVWFIRLTGCRPSEAARMRLADIRDRDRKVWRYTPRRHKTSHMGKHRHIAIGPQAQAIVLAHTEGRDPREYVFSPQRSVPPRKTADGTIPMMPRNPSPRVGRLFKKDAINRAVQRAIQRANEARQAEGLPLVPKWTPYCLRYTRLREVRRQAGSEATQAIAGHSRATMTEWYAPAGWGKAARAAMRSG